MSDERLNTLERISVLQEQQITDLSEMVNAQWKEIDRLKRKIEKAGAKIQSLEDNIDAPDADVPPPHY
jgi:SlyX protein